MPRSDTHPWFIAIGASGPQGLTDIRELLHALPAGVNAVVMIVLHRPWDKVSHLQSILARASCIPVVIAGDGDRFEAGVAYIGEPAAHLTLVARSFGELVEDPQRTYSNRTVDLLFRSVAMHGRERTIGVVLSGSLDDGSRGLAAIHATGGLTMVLTPSGYAGMPANAIAFDGPIDTIGDTQAIAAAIGKALGYRDVSAGAA
jgi:chemotaxis response regulator CheB